MEVFSKGSRLFQSSWTSISLQKTRGSKEVVCFPDGYSSKGATSQIEDTSLLFEADPNPGPSPEAWSKVFFNSWSPKMAGYIPLDKYISCHNKFAIRIYPGNCSTVASVFALMETQGRKPSHPKHVVIIPTPCQPSWAFLLRCHLRRYSTGLLL